MSWEVDEGSKLAGTFQATAEFFGLGNVLDSRRVGGNANKNYQIITDKGDFVFKVILEHPLEDLKTEIVYLERLKESAFPATYYLPSLNGSQIFQHDGQVLVAMPKLNGENPTPSEDICFSVGQNIARLNTIPTHSLPQRNHWLKQDYLSRAVEKIKQHFPEKARRFEESFGFLKDFPYGELPQSIVHGDMAPVNCLYKDSQLIGFLDWEEVGLAPSILDLGTCILNFCFDRNEFKSELYKAMINGYQQVRQLTPLELKSLQASIRYAGLTLSSWRLLQFGIYHPDSGKIKDYEYYWTMNLDNLRLPAE